MPADVVDLIMQDHREVERLFDELQKHPEKRRNLVPVLATLMTAHSRAEEAEVYPVARREAGEVEEIAHSQEEHAQAEQLLAQLTAADPESAQFERLLTQVQEMITQHVAEEESMVLPAMRQRLTEKRLAELADAFATSRARHLGAMPGDLTKEELQLQASNLGVRGASSMSKAELERQLKS